jgi:outer membrane protein assembly factor BamB
VYGLDAATGTKVWRFAARASVVSSPAVANGMVYVGSNDGRLLAFALP